ncbi:protein D-63 [Sulfolobus sp. SCGC AB-777_G06]|nr:protein D-63 [Sulfolobus sp. SCGC AB-777_G06]
MSTANTKDLDELFYGLDTEIRKLLTLVHEIKIDIILQKDTQNKVERAIVLSRRIQDELQVLRK